MSNASLNLEPYPAPKPSPSQNSPGFLAYLLFFLILAWVGGLSLLVLAGSWLMEQLLFEGSLGVPDIRWLIALIFAVMCLLPLSLIRFLVRDAWFKARLDALLLLSLPALLTVPLRLLPLTAFQATTGLQSLIIGCLALWVALRQRRRGALPPDKGWWLGVLLAMLLGISWAHWGALGSPLDTLLGLIDGGLLGLYAALVLQGGMRHGQPQETYNRWGTFADLVFVAIGLTVFASGVGQTNTQVLLTSTWLPLAPLAFLLLRPERKQPTLTRWFSGGLLLGLSAAWALIWVDPDELMLVVVSAPGELLGDVARVLLINALLALGLALVIGFLKRLRGSVLEGSIPASLFVPLGGVLALLASYFVGGQPGFYGERLFVILKSQADVSEAANIESYQARRAYVYQHLVEHAEATQQRLRERLEHWGIRYRPYYLVNALEVEGGPLVRAWLLAQPEVDRVLDSPHLRPLAHSLTVNLGQESGPTGIPWNLSMIGADKVWQEFGVTGRGIVIGQSDSGVQLDHPEVADSYLGRNGDHDYHWYDPWFGSQKPQDFGGHGTHTLATILGNTVGVAPDAEWIGCVNLARNLGNPALYLECLQFMLAPFPQNGDPFHDGDPARGAYILNNSWGCPSVEGCDALVFLPAVRALRTAGVFVVASAGNSGAVGCGSVDSPLAIYDEVYTVGAVGHDGLLAPFSSLGPVKVDGSLRVKPDILAPGSSILSAFPGGTYQVADGTSMAGPHVAGVVALMWSANPRLIGDIDATEAILNQSAMPYQGSTPHCGPSEGYPQNGIGYGIINAEQAVKRALEWKQ